MSRREIVAGLPLATGSALISVALLNSTLLEGAFILEAIRNLLRKHGVEPFYLELPEEPVKPVSKE